MGAGGSGGTAGGSSGGGWGNGGYGVGTFGNSYTGGNLGGAGTAGALSGGAGGSAMMGFGNTGAGGSGMAGISTHSGMTPAGFTPAYGDPRGYSIGMDAFGNYKGSPNYMGQGAPGKVTTMAPKNIPATAPRLYHPTSFATPIPTQTTPLQTPLPPPGSRYPPMTTGYQYGIPTNLRPSGVPPRGWSSPGFQPGIFNNPYPGNYPNSPAPVQGPSPLRDPSSPIFGPPAPVSPSNSPYRNNIDFGHGGVVGMNGGSAPSSGHYP